ncbi:YeeE/YedE family protein [Mycoplasma feriruminatoris]|uniref:YeeE/YedE thiosulfate transporter family protein n=1 Tax=Mycoplasma feriruminatoris TaxID=1179777 RepID=UPI00241F06FC|nr:YeeE/YedE thiosulfate transporter family protein [Mycoplasma feriruminatoris]WFQ91066.1 YeeE/YedE family protein [Mycoplasma feriruminatoris]
MKTKFIQPIIALIILVLLITLTIFLKSTNLRWSLVIGFILGYVINRSSFNFSIGIKQAYLYKNTNLTKAFILLLVFSLLIVFIIKMISNFYNLNLISNISDVNNISILTFIGSFLIGISIIITSNCASGILVDLAKGKIKGLIGVIFFIIGSVVGYISLKSFSKTSFFIKTSTKVFLLNHIGFLTTLICSLLVLFILYLIVKKYEHEYQIQNFNLKINDDKLINNSSKKLFSYQTYYKLFVKNWSFITASILISICASFILVINNKTWGVSRPFLIFFTYLCSVFKINLSNQMFADFIKITNNGLLNDSSTLINIGFFIGCLVCCLLANKFKCEFKINKKELFYFTIGGFLLGFGSGLANGCSVGGMYSKISTFDLSGWVFLIGMIIGIFVGIKIFIKKHNIKSQQTIVL